MNWLGKLFYKYHYTHTKDLGEIPPENFAMSLSTVNSFIEIISNNQNENISILSLPYQLRQA